ncbi:PH domain-containing protein [Gallaecimonas sp. GXIMD1310]|uniref:PH domain-containing protein n=1 Tax=Gallaecimonas sp. GXIMD1310 TaxID=3131926 RepID=UPI003249A060
MSYVENNLMRDEKVVYKANIHWFVFVPGIALFVISMILFAGSSESGAPFFGFMILIVAIISLIKALILKTTTELAITTKRVIAKVGLIRRNTVELNHSKVESFNVDQSIFGRVFGFGTLFVNGTGGGKTPIPSIDDPLEFRRNAMETIDAS